MPKRTDIKSILIIGLVLLVIWLPFLNNQHYAYIDGAIPLHTNSTYAIFSDINLDAENVYNAYNKGELLSDGIVFHTTNFVDSQEGNGALHIGNNGVDSGGRQLCGWNAEHTQLESCPKDLPFWVERQENGKLRLYLRVDSVKKNVAVLPIVHSTGEIVLSNICDKQEGFYITSFDGMELFLRNKLQHCKQIKTDQKGIV